jgi:hypothetical protein
MIPREELLNRLIVAQIDIDYQKNQIRLLKSALLACAVRMPDSPEGQEAFRLLEPGGDCYYPRSEP